MSREVVRPAEKVYHFSRLPAGREEETCLRKQVIDPCFINLVSGGVIPKLWYAWCAHLDLNQGPLSYQDSALTRLSYVRLLSYWLFSY